MASSVSQFEPTLHTISVGDRSFMCAPGVTILQALAEHEIFLPSACGGRGSCAACKCTISSPKIAHGLKEIPYLSPEEQDAQVHLACQVRVSQSIDLIVASETLKARAYAAKIDRIEMLDESQVFVYLTMETDGMAFLAGQFFLLEAADAFGVIFRRAYSLVNSPQSPKSPALFVGLKPGGRMSQFFGEGSTKNVRLIGPFGEFLPFKQARHEIWIAANSGIAPFLSMLADETLWGGDAPRRTLLYRNSGNVESALLQKFATPPRRRAALKLFFDDGNQVKQGLSARLTEFLSQTTELPDCALICSSPAETDACANILIAAGLDPNAIRRDTF